MTVSLSSAVAHPPHSRRGGAQLWLLVAAAVLLAVGGWWWLARSTSRPRASYETAPTTRADVTSRVTSTGTLQAVTKVTVGSQVSGIIETILVDYNSRVKKGQVLAQLDPSLFQAQLNQSQANLSSQLANLGAATANAANAAAGIKTAEAGIATAEARVETAQAGLLNARAALEAARSNLERALADELNAERSYRRYQALHDSDLVARSERDQAQTQWLMARSATAAQRAQVASAEANRRSGEAGVRAARSDLDAARVKRGSALDLEQGALASVQAAQAQVAQARASVQQAQVNLSRTTIRSPIDGIVLNRNINVGQTVAAQFQAPDLFTLAENLRSMQVETNVDEADVGRIRQGAHASFTVDAYPTEDFEGEVRLIRQSPTTVQNVVTYQVIVRCVNRSLKLKPGMTATVNIEETRKRNVLTVPNAALRFKPADAEGNGGRSKDAKSTASPQATPRHGGERGNGVEKERGQGGASAKRERRASVWTPSTSDPTKPEEHRLQLGITDGTITEVLDGDLKEGDVVITGSGDEKKGSASSNGGSRSRMRFF